MPTVLTGLDVELPHTAEEYIKDQREYVKKEMFWDMSQEAAAARLRRFAASIR